VSSFARGRSASWRPVRSVGPATPRPDRATFTRLLTRIPSDGDSRKRLFAAVYDELRALARGLMRAERAGHTLRPTALVNEAYIRLIEHDRITWQNRAHFFGIAARAMRQILVDHAREKNARKRGGRLTRVTLDEALALQSPVDCDILDLHACLERLAALDPRMAQVVELRAFAGMSSKEVSRVLGVSQRTVDSDWSFARLWLARELSGKAS